MSADVQTIESVELPKDLQDRAAAAVAAYEAMPIDTLIDRVNLLKEVMKRCMVEGQHLGTIPGTRKPSLWKPGAELICTLFQLGTRYPKSSMRIERENGHFRFTLTCELFHIPTGHVVGEGVGGSSTMEYRFRVQTEDRYMAGGAGSNGPSGAGQPIKAKYTPYDFYNTVLKVAKKRSFVDAVLTVSGASQIFTQDTEDMPEDLRQGLEPDGHAGDAGQTTRRTLPHATKPNGSPKPAAGALQPIEGVVQRAWPNDYQGKRYWFAKVNGQQLQTTEEGLGEALLNSIGKEIRAQAEASPKPGKWYVKGVQQKALPVPAAVEPERKVIHNPGNAAGVARQKAREAAKERYANEGLKPLPPRKATESGNGIPMGNRTPYDEACERLAALQPPLKEYWVVRAAQRLGWIKGATERLADLNEKSLRILLVGWTDLVAAARREEAGVQEDAPPQAA